MTISPKVKKKTKASQNKLENFERKKSTYHPTYHGSSPGRCFALSSDIEKTSLKVKRSDLKFKN